jgi:hypothetical protein
VFPSNSGEYDLTILMGVLGYTENWRDYVAWVDSPYLFVQDYIPPKAMGYIKSTEELIDCVEKYFSIKTKVVLDNEQIFLFAERIT